MLIPYFIQQIQPLKNNPLYHNIDTVTGCCKKEHLDDVFSIHIAKIMIESLDYINNVLKIDTYSWKLGNAVVSYNCWCKMYFYKLKDIDYDSIDTEWKNVFKVFYFEDNKWNEWDLDYNSDIIWDNKYEWMNYNILK